jgi:hypothetical protein
VGQYLDFIFEILSHGKTEKITFGSLAAHLALAKHLGLTLASAGQTLNARPLITFFFFREQYLDFIIFP